MVLCASLFIWCSIVLVHDDKLSCVLVSFCRSRRYFIDTLKSGLVTCDTVLYNYATGNCLGTIHFVWKVPTNCDAAPLMSGNGEAFRKIQPSLPVYHTRAMKKHFFDQIALLQCGKPSALRGIYRLLTGKNNGGWTWVAFDVLWSKLITSPVITACMCYVYVHNYVLCFPLVHGMVKDPLGQPE